MASIAAAPDFNLPGVDGRQYTLASFSDKKVLVVVFSCNHCPYVQAYEDRMKDIQTDYAGRGVQLVAVNPNDAKNYPEDSFEMMARRAKDRGFNFPYLRDETQETAKAYGATHTPQLFVFGPDRKLAYAGKIDDDWQSPDKVKRRYLREALDALTTGQRVKEPETFAIGCTIKWKR